MDTYKFYYDESEHSRKINYNTVTAPNYYDNFVTVVVGWAKEKEREVFKKYEDFENKYADRKDRNGELKSTTLKQRKFECGFASLDKANTQFIMDFLSIFDESTKIICEWDNAWYKSYAGIYSDDLVCFIGLLGYMAHFENTEQIINEKLEMQSEYFNGYVCRQLSDYFNRRQSKLPIDFIDENDKDYFLNNRGAKVYYDITKQPILQIAEGSQTEMVLSVGMNKSGIPLITISNENNPVCYRLPEELSDWAYTAIGMANMGENLFPSQVVFTKEKKRYFADIL